MNNTRYPAIEQSLSEFELGEPASQIYEDPNELKYPKYWWFLCLGSVMGLQSNWPHAPQGAKFKSLGGLIPLTFFTSSIISVFITHIIYYMDIVGQLYHTSVLFILGSDFADSSQYSILSCSGVFWSAYKV